MPGLGRHLLSSLPFAPVTTVFLLSCPPSSSLVVLCTDGSLFHPRTQRGRSGLDYVSQACYALPSPPLSPSSSSSSSSSMPQSRSTSNASSPLLRAQQRGLVSCQARQRRVSTFTFVPRGNVAESRNAEEGEAEASIKELWLHACGSGAMVSRPSIKNAASSALETAKKTRVVRLREENASLRCFPMNHPALRTVLAQHDDFLLKVGRKTFRGQSPPPPPVRAPHSRRPGDSSLTDASPRAPTPPPAPAGSGRPSPRSPTPDPCARPPPGRSTPCSGRRPSPTG